jgi:Uma2 family endonuclease
MNPPTVLHYRIAKFLERILDEITEQSYPEWEVFREVGQRTGAASSRLPDLAIVPRAEADTLLNQTAVFQTPSWLVVEIVSASSAKDDSFEKLGEYEALGIPEYWVIDPDGLGAAKYLGFPKALTVVVYHLVDGRYEGMRFRNDDRIDSALFPTLDLTAAQLLHPQK